MLEPIQTALEKLSSSNTANTNRITQSSRQRRSSIYEEFGVPYEFKGDSSDGSDNVATVYFAISPDMTYIARWEFKMLIKPFIVPLSGANGIRPATLEIKDTSLSINNSSISPNPHTHEITPNPHTHTVTPGISASPSDVSDLKIAIDGIDISDKLAEQYDLPDNNGMFPDSTVANRYDLLKVCNDMADATRSKVLSAGYHKLTIASGGIIEGTLFNFIKYGSINRQGDTTDESIADIASVADSDEIWKSSEKVDNSAEIAKIKEDINGLDLNTYQGKIDSLLLKSQLLELEG